MTLDAPELFGFFSNHSLPSQSDGMSGWRFNPYIMGGAEDDSDSDKDKETEDTDSEKEDKTGDGTGSDKPDEDKKFTQEDVTKAATAAAAKAKRGLLSPKDLGFESAKAMQDFVETMKGKEAADKTEAEKKVEEAIKEAKETAESTVLSKANERIIRAEFLLAAKEHDVEWTDDAFAIAKSLDVWDVTVDDEGKVSGLTDEMFEELKEKKPFLFKSDKDDDDEGDANSAGHRAGGGAKVSDETKLREAYPALGN